MTEIAVWAGRHEGAAPMMRWKLVNQVVVNPNEPDDSRDAEEQASCLRRTAEELREGTPMRVFEENCKLGETEDRNPSVPNFVDIFRVEEALYFFGGRELLIHDCLKNRQAGAHHKVTAGEDVEGRIENYEGERVKDEDESEQTPTAHNHRS